MRIIQTIFTAIKSLYYNPRIQPLPYKIRCEFNEMISNMYLKYNKKREAYDRRISYNYIPFKDKVDKFNIFLKCVRLSFPAYNTDINNFVNMYIELENAARLQFALYISLNTQYLYKHDNVDGECPICYENGRLITLYCNHSFHENCLLQWIRTGQTSCPCCRKDIINNEN